MKKLTKLLICFSLGLLLIAVPLTGCDLASIDLTEVDLAVHYIDVGQADSILIQLPNGENMLIDAGNNADGDLLVDYLNNLGISAINYLVGTHPHEDHIGGLDNAIRAFKVDNFYMPKISHTTKTFQDVLTASEENNLEITTAKAGDNILDEGNLEISILAPVNSKYEDLNNHSAVVRLAYGDTSFLFMGDAEEESEEEILSTNANLKSDVLKVGHHGSSSSTSSEFLKAVDPSYAIICVGEDNDYGHPHKETIERLGDIPTYRTDLNGTIVITSDGNSLNINTEK